MLVFYDISIKLFSPNSQNKNSYSHNWLVHEFIYIHFHIVLETSMLPLSRHPIFKEYSLFQDIYNSTDLRQLPKTHISLNCK